MSRIIWIFVFIAVFLALDFYVFEIVKQLTRNLSLRSQKAFKIGYWSIPLLAVSFFLIGFFLFPDKISPKWRNFMATFVFVMYTSKIFAAVILASGDLVRGIKWTFNKVLSFFTENTNSEPVIGEKISRSDFLAKTALTVGAFHIGTMAYGIVSGAHNYKVHRLKVPLKNLPKAFHGIKIAQLSDIHSGSFFNKTAVLGGVEMLMAEKPDVVFFTGDLVNNKAEEFKDYFNVFNKINAPLGVFSTLGNHDYGDYTSWDSAQQKVQNLNDLKEAHRLMGWNLLLDEHKALKVNNESLGILGIQNWGAGGFAKYGDLGKALKSTEEYPVKLLLSHDPSHWRAQVLNQTNIDIAFAGHTHGMQYGVEVGDFKWSPVQWRYKEWAGLYSENNQHLYVNRGYGYIGFPGRVGILPEITIMELTKA